MAAYNGRFELSINAPVDTVFEYCRDPRKIYAGDPTHNVSESTLFPEGVGTRAKVVVKTVAFTEEIAIEYVECVPDQTIVFTGDPKMTIAGLGPFGDDIHTWTWTFAPEDGGTRMTVVVVSQEDAPWWERLFDRITAKNFSKEITGRLARIKAGAEEQAASELVAVAR